MARKFKRKQEAEKKEFWSKRNLMSLFIITIMVLSVAGFVMIQNNQDTFNTVYGEFTFKQTPSVYITKIDGVERSFRYHPSQVEDLNISKSAIDALKQTKMVYVTYDPDTRYPQVMGLLSYELTQELSDAFDMYVLTGLTDENDYDAQIITCEEATADVPVIYFKESEEPQILYENGCIILEGKSEFDFSYEKDRLMYGIFGVIE